VTILVTGSAGFIGFHLSRRLLDAGEAVVGLDSLNAYYDPSLKAARLAILEGHEGYRHAKLDLTDAAGVMGLVAATTPTAVINLAAQAGVRYSLESPRTYVDSNVVGFLNILEACRAHPPRHLMFASTSSIYGNHANMPFSVHDAATHPITLYSASKAANEAMAHAYAHLFGIPATGFRFFTVYGPWGRPDMALFKFTDAILNDRPIDVYGEGKMSRDFTYVDDIVDGLVAAIDRPPAPNPAWDATRPDPATSAAPWRMLNLGASRRVELMRYIEVLEAKLGKTATLNLLPMQPGDVAATDADVTETKAVLGYQPKVTVEEGVGRFVDWYREYYRV
jgi:UDP-glucuronate 4-epimerase